MNNGFDNNFYNQSENSGMNNEGVHQENGKTGNFQNNGQQYYRQNQNGGFGYQNPYGEGYGPFYGYADESGLFSENKMARVNGRSANVKISDWLKFDCLSFINLIPVVGFIAYLVIYIIILCSGKTNVSIKNRMIASLIWSGIAVGIWVALILFLAVFGASVATNGVN